MSEISKEKYCCSSCANKRRCHICGNVTDMACSDCRIDLGAIIYVCKTAACLMAHEQKCAYSRRAEVQQLGKQVKMLRDALGMMYDKWENGVSCYEDPEDYTGPIGNAFQLSLAEEQTVLNLIVMK